MGNTIKAIRKTTESEMGAILDFSGVRPDYRRYINTTVPFLDHMIEHIAYRSNINIETRVELKDFTLMHLIAEDLGTALGKAFKEYIDSADGAIGYGDAVGIIDEAKAQCAVSFESRAYIDIDYHGNTIPEMTEGMMREDLETFLEGFCQGAMCTLHVDLFKGHNGHHIWEAVYRALGTALGRVAEASEARRGKTAGVAGKIEWIVEK